MGPDHNVFAEKRSRDREKAEACAAFDAMVADRSYAKGCPRKPPSRSVEIGPVRTAAALAAARDRRLGILDER